jgi:type IV secretory pathway VirB2 component (pilin)
MAAIPQGIANFPGIDWTLRPERNDLRGIPRPEPGRRRRLTLALFPSSITHRSARTRRQPPRRRNQFAAAVTFVVITLPMVASAHSGSILDTGFTNLQTLFTGTIAKVVSLIAIVIGGYQFAQGEPGSKKSAAEGRAPDGGGRRLPGAAPSGGAKEQHRREKRTARSRWCSSRWRASA